MKEADNVRGRLAKEMLRSDMRTTMNIYGDVLTGEMATAGLKLSALYDRFRCAQH